jgi:pyrimidine operon attenuation protein/uracil phosphoribosyltransferase
MNVEFKEKRTLMDKNEVKRTIERLSSEIIVDDPERKSLCIMGIRKRGDVLAKRLSKILEKKTSWEIKVGVLDITLYRDDLTIYGPKPVIGSTNFPCPIDGKEVLLVDDVFYTGRTIRCALDEIMDYGRPISVRLAVMVNRGGRELPISPDYTGISIELKDKEEVRVLFKETDGEDSVKIVEVKLGAK